MDLQEHILCLQKLCRLCGKSIKTDSHYRNPKLKGQFSDIFQKYFEVDVNEESCNTFPPSLCQKCYIKLYKLGKSQTIPKDKNNIQLYDFQPHSENCIICNPEARAGRPKVEKTEEIITLKHLKLVADKYGFYFSGSDQPDRFEFFKFENMKSEPVTTKKVTIMKTGQWEIQVLKKTLTKDKYQSLIHIPDVITPFLCDTLFGKWSGLKVCPGNDDYSTLINEKLKVFENFRSTDNTVIARIEMFDGRSKEDLKVIRHRDCKLFLAENENRCGPCNIYRTSLNIYESRRKSADGKVPHKFKNDRYLNAEETLDKLSRLEKERKCILAQSVKWQAHIKMMIQNEGVLLQNDICEVMSSVIEEKNCPFDPTSPQFLLWEQQKLQSKMQDKRGMRWHPVIIRWCLSIYLKSPGAYKHIKSMGFLNLPCKNTLLKYINFTNPQCGFNKDIISRLMDAVDFGSIKEYQKNVSLIFDEMKIKSGLIFCKSTGKLVGFSEMGDINDVTSGFERTVREEKTSASEPSLARYVIVFMVRGIFSSLCYPFGYFASEGFKSDQIYHCAWEAIRILEAIGLKVRAVVADGASPNRKFIRLHNMIDNGNMEDGVVYWAWNEWCPARKIFFICDVPHLIKTARNNLENSHGNLKTRNLILHGQELGWHQIISLYEWDNAFNRDVIGLRMGHKLKFEHIYLNPNSRMRVNLAAQVLSATVANMLDEQGLESTRSLRVFIRKIDKFFDCLNVAKRCNTTRKAELNPYLSEDDPRLEWLENQFLGFINDWEREVHAVEDLSKDEKNRLCLSRQTLEGFRITVHAFVSLARTLFREGGFAYLLSEKLTQDPLEEYFSKQRQKLGCNDNPSLQEFGRNFIGLNVAGDDLVRVMSGNTRGRLREQARVDIENFTLPPMKKRKKDT